MAETTLPVRRLSPSRWVPRFGRSFYFIMSLVIAGAVVYGFSLTIDRKLIHPAIPRPWVLYVHAAVFFGWVLLFVVQTGLIQSRNVKLHRLFGWGGLVLGVLISVVGVSTTLEMARFNILNGQAADKAAAFLVIPLNDMLGFTTSFGLAIWWRRKPEFHRRLMLIASCCLTAAVFGRLSFIPIPALRWYAGVDALILLGVARDLLVIRKVHPVYLYGLPLLIFVQAVTMVMYLQQTPAWMTIAHWLIG